MGWRKVCDLECEPKAKENCCLMSRGGLEGVEVTIDNRTIKIPREIIMKMFVDEYISRQISRYEGMSFDDAIKEIKKGA